MLRVLAALGLDSRSRDADEHRPTAPSSTVFLHEEARRQAGAAASGEAAFRLPPGLGRSRRAAAVALLPGRGRSPTSTTTAGRSSKACCRRATSCARSPRLPRLRRQPVLGARRRSAASAPERSAWPESAPRRPGADLAATTLAATTERLDGAPRRDARDGPCSLLERIEEEEGIRISLAGAHDKIGVLSARNRGEIGLTAGRPPSTHILKLPIARVANRSRTRPICMTPRIAAAGLDVADVEPWLVGDHEFLLVRRYDRATPPRRTGSPGGLLPGPRHRPGGEVRRRGRPRCRRLHGADPATPASSRDRHRRLHRRLVFNFLDRQPRRPREELLAAAWRGRGRSAGASLRPRLRPPCSTARGRSWRCASAARAAPDTCAAVTSTVSPTNSRSTGACPGIGRSVDDAAGRCVERRARSSLPTEFQDRPIIDRIDAVIEERAERLLKARGEAAERPCGAARWACGAFALLLVDPLAQAEEVVGAADDRHGDGERRRGRRPRPGPGWRRSGRSRRRSGGPSSPCRARRRRSRGRARRRSCGGW